MKKPDTILPLVRERVDDSLILWIRGQGSRGLSDKVLDLSGKNNHGTIIGATWSNTPLNHPCLNFDGTDDYVNAGKASSLDITGAFTIEMWVKIPTGAATDNYLLAKHNGTTAQYTVVLDANAKIIVGTTAGSLQGVGVLSRDVWYHIAVGRDASSNGFIYLNGLVDVIGTLGVPSSVDVNLNIPGRTTGLFGQQSVIDEVRIYNRALSMSEISNLYNEVKQNYGR